MLCPMPRKPDGWMAWMAWTAAQPDWSGAYIKNSEKYNTQKKHLAIIYTNTGISSTSTGSHMVNNLTQSYIVYFLSVFQLFCAKCSHEIHHPPLCCKTRSWPAVPLPPSQHCRRCKRCCFGFYQHDEASGISQPTDFFERSADEDATRMQNNTWLGKWLRL